MNINKNRFIIYLSSFIVLCLFFCLSVCVPLSYGEENAKTPVVNGEKTAKTPTADSGKTVTIPEDEWKKMQEQFQQLQFQVDSLKEEVKTLKEQKPTGEPTVQYGATPTLQESPPQPQPGVSTRGESGTSNPNISVIGDFVWNINHNKNIDEGNPMDLRELEIGIEDTIDPYCNAKAFIGLHNHDGEIHVHLEEAYATFDKLPMGLQLKAGKFFTAFGKDNTFHQHFRPYGDKPLMVENFLGEEGMSGTGASLSAMIPLGNIYGEAVIEAINDDNTTSFSGSSGKPLYNGHLKLFTDLSDSSNLELGYSHMRGYNDKNSTRMTYLNGVDLTYRWRPLQTGKYQGLLLRGEYLWSRRKNPDRILNNTGGYIFGEYQFHRNWAIGGRYDVSQFPSLVNMDEKAYSGILTYRPTEFSFYRLQYKNTKPSWGNARNQWFFQFNYMIGPHGAHKF